ncbi:MAG: cyclopropane-fatty-acyl-phospholipid synthase family protein [Actinobacteria bacterium]|nr:cyclopropane-fatty-acyl-phospholipid synthase family protein [Actinomycetota bacterium]
METEARALEGTRPVDDPAVEEKISFDKQAIPTHYDLPPAFFASFLGPWMAYSCAYFVDEDGSLERAEEDKLLLTAKKLRLKEDDCILDVGCGWGSFIFFAAEKYGCRAVGTTLSEEQARLVNTLAAERGLSDRIRADVLHVYEMDYPDASFDKIVTIGAIEHMEDLGRVFARCSALLRDDGLFLVHGMTQPWRSREETLAGIRTESDDLLEEHFGVGHWHSLWEVIEALEKNDFEVLDHENITNHYKLTVERWLERLIDGEEKIVGEITPEEKYREFIAFFASYIFSFEMNNTLCNQILCRKIKRGELRPNLPLTREHMILHSKEA